MPGPTYDEHETETKEQAGVVCLCARLAAISYRNVNRYSGRENPWHNKNKWNSFLILIISIPPQQNIITITKLVLLLSFCWFVSKSVPLCWRSLLAQTTGRLRPCAPRVTAQNLHERAILPTGVVLWNLVISASKHKKGEESIGQTKAAFSHLQSRGVLGFLSNAC